MLISHAKALHIAHAVAIAAADEIMPRFARVHDLDVREKTSAFDVVTEADEAMERALSAALVDAYPESVIVGEEMTARDPNLLDRIGTAELAFVVDPIDGTKNFTGGLPLFGTMIAGVARGEIVFGLIHDPVAGSTALALRGEGASLLLKDGSQRGLRVAPPVPVDRMDAIVGVNFLPEPLKSTVAGNLPKLGMSSWLRCAAHEYRLAASGQCHLLFYNKLAPWDHAAGWLIHREAGGYSAHFDGSAYLPTHHSGGLICAPDKESWGAAKEALFAEARRLPDPG